MSDLTAGEPSTRWKYRRAASCLVLSLISYEFVFYTAAAEPYIVFRWSDLALNFGVGGIVFMLFAAWGAAGVRQFRRAARRTRFSTALLSASLLWTAINLFYLGISIVGYAQDMNNPRLHCLR